MGSGGSKEPLRRPAPAANSTSTESSLATFRPLYNDENRTRPYEPIKSHLEFERIYRANKGYSDCYDTYEKRVADNANRKLREHEEQLHQIKLRQARSQYSVLNPLGTRLPAQKPVSKFGVVPILPLLRTVKLIDAKYFTPEKKKPELTASMQLKIDEACIPYPPSECLTEIDGVQILRKDIQTLTRLNWLNDEIINAYMSLLVLRAKDTGYKSVYAFNTFFYPKVKESGYASVRRWTRKVDIFNYDFIIVPVHLGNHWCLALIDFTKKTISYYDSLGGSSSGCCDILLDYLREESSDKKKIEFDDAGWRLIDMSQENIPLQKNFSDCGVFTCIYALYLTAKEKLKFSQEDMPYFRRRMIYEILTKRILE